MLDSCGKHNITVDVEVIAIQQVNEAYESLLKQDVKYRFSIDWPPSNPHNHEQTLSGSRPLGNTFTRVGNPCFCAASERGDYRQDYSINLASSSRPKSVFRTSNADLPFVTCNAELLSMLTPQFEEELKHYQGQETFPERVRATIQRKLAGQRPRMQEIASELHISSRTLQRRLQDAGYSFQLILEEARRQLARHYLNNSLLELNETAYLLGYEDANSFVQAFRAREGVPPAHWREAQRELDRTVDDLRNVAD